MWFEFDQASLDEHVRTSAVHTLGKLEPEALVEHASSVVARLDNPSEIVRSEAFDALSALPQCVTRGIDLTCERLRSRVVSHGDAKDLRSRILGRAGWCRYRLRLRVQPVALYWYALPYRPGGAGYARDVDAWDRMSNDSLRI